MTTTTILILTASSVFWFAFGYVVGFSFGVERGRDSEWLDAFWRKVAEDRRRRNASGQFKCQEKLNGRN